MKGIVAGFPGIGKSQYTSRQGLLVVDLYSSMYTREGGVFPQNYVDAIIYRAKYAGMVLCSVHANVRAELIARGVPFTLVYPTIEQKQAYIQRYVARGSGEAFVLHLDQHWDQYIRECEATQDPLVTHVRLASGEYLSDVCHDWI